MINIVIMAQLLLIELAQIDCVQERATVNMDLLPLTARQGQFKTKLKHLRTSMWNLFIADVHKVCECTNRY